MRGPNLSDIAHGTRHEESNSDQRSQRSPQKISAYRDIQQVANDQFPQSSRTVFLPVAISAEIDNNRNLLFRGRSGLETSASKEAHTRRARHRTYLTVFIGLPDFIRVSSSFGLASLGRFSTGPQTEDVRYDISCTGCTSLGLHPQRNLHMGLTFSIRVILRVLSQAL